MNSDEQLKTGCLFGRRQRPLPLTIGAEMRTYCLHREPVETQSAGVRAGGSQKTTAFASAAFG
jgi:hypothetical protein